MDKSLTILEEIIKDKRGWLKLLIGFMAGEVDEEQLPLDDFNDEDDEQLAKLYSLTWGS